MIGGTCLQTWILSNEGTQSQVRAYYLSELPMSRNTNLSFERDFVLNAEIEPKLPSKQADINGIMKPTAPNSQLLAAEIAGLSKAGLVRLRTCLDALLDPEVQQDPAKVQYIRSRIAEILGPPPTDEQMKPFARKVG